jgi:hypothetical protein
MKTPKTVKGYLKLLIAIANDSAYDLKNAKSEEIRAIADCRADIQNCLGEELMPLLKKYKLEWNG